MIELTYYSIFNKKINLLVCEIGIENLFSQELHQDAVRLGIEFYSQYHQVPTVEAFFTAFRRKYAAKYNEVDFIALYKAFKDLEQTANESVASFYYDHLAEIKRRKTAESVLQHGVDLVEKGEIDQFIELVIKKLAFQNKYISSAKLLQDAELVLQSLREIEQNRIMSLLPSLDQLLGGGFASKELVVILGGTGGGKTTFLINLAWAAMIQSKKVLYYTFEVSKERILARLMSLVLQKPFKQIINRPQESLEALHQHNLAVFFNNCKVIEAPTFSMSVHQLEADVETQVLTEGPQDMIIVDYADIMLPDHRYAERWLELENSYMYLRSIAQKHEAVLITASQVNREGAQATKIRNEHVRGAYGKIQNADVVLALNRTNDDKERGTVKISVNKNRNYLADRVIEVMADFELMSFYEPGKPH